MPRFSVLLLACAVVVGGSALGVSSAETPKSGRAKFVKRADDICEPARAVATKKIDHGARLLQRRHPSVRRAGRHFVAAYRVLRAGYREVANLPRPFEFHKAIARWLRRERHATAVGVRSAIALKRSRFHRARRLSRRSARLERDAARVVRNFDFQHCRPL